MKIYITEEAMALGDTESGRYLDRIIDTVCEGWHEWLVEDPEQVESSAWFGQDRSPWVKEMLEQAGKASSYPKAFPKREVVVGAISGSGALSPSSTAKYLSQPLTVLMENLFTDRILLDTALSHFSCPEMQDLLTKVPAVLDRRGAGGIGEIPKQTRDLVDQAQTDGIPVRLVVFADSDALCPGTMSVYAQALKDTCRDFAVPCKILKKRSIENYIPDEVLDDWVANPDNTAVRPRVAALKQLSPPQRDHFNMKKGFQNKPFTPEQSALYNTVDRGDIDVLQRGFGDDVIERLKDNGEALTAEALERRDGNGELRGLVTMIRNEL